MDPPWAPDEQRPPPATPPRHSIPLQNLARQDMGPEDEYYYGNRLQAGAYVSHTGGQREYQTTSGPTAAQLAANLPGISTYWDQPYAPHPDDGVSPESPIDPAALQFALPPDIQQPSQNAAPQAIPAMSDPYESHSLYYDDAGIPDYSESDREPLTSQAQPISGTLDMPGGEAQPRDSFQTVSDLDNSPARPRDTRTLGFDLEPGYVAAGHRNYGKSLAPGDYRRSRSPSTSGALYRAGSIVRAMSQRVVMISGEGELVNQRAQRERSRSPSNAAHNTSPHHSGPMLVDTSYPSQVFQMPPEKQGGEPEFYFPDPPQIPMSRGPMQNPLKGKSLGVFSPENPVRERLCNLLVNPWTEPFILLLIVLQAILLAVEASPNVFLPGNARPDRWGKTQIDWAMFGLFIVFTLELIARIIVSGLVLNAAEYSTIDRKKGVRAAVADQYRAIFQPQRQKSVKGPRQPHLGPSAFARSFTIMQGQALPQTVEEQQRWQLARRAFLRHGFNRLDFVAVVSFWISFVLGITGIESSRHLYVFRMLSCLRILRLLSLTNGTAVSCSNTVQHIFNTTNRKLDHLEKSKKGSAAPCQGSLSYLLLLASVRHHWRTKLQSQLKPPMRLARS
jgi:voltage-dependent calcium channel